MYESSGPDVKIRGTASHIAEKYLQLARDAQSSGDPIAAENYYQHAEHYFRLIAAAQEQLRQSQPYYQQQQGDVRGNFADDAFDDAADEQPHLAGEPFAPREPQPFYAREPREPQSQPFQPRTQPAATGDEDEVDRLPSFITGGQQPQQPPPQGQAPTGANGYDGQSDRFPLHRRRRRHRGTRDQSGTNDGDSPAASGPRNADD
jgi:hypothetical protein